MVRTTISDTLKSLYTHNFQPSYSLSGIPDSDYADFKTLFSDDLDYDEMSGSDRTPGSGWSLLKTIDAISELDVPAADLEVTIPSIGTFDLLDVILMLWLGWKCPWFSILGFSIPTGPVVYMVVKDKTVPFSEFFDPFLNARYSGVETGFTFKDAVIDIFALWCISKVIQILGNNALSAIRYILKWWRGYRQCKLKDVILRIKEASSSNKYDESELTIRKLVENLQANVVDLANKVGLKLAFL